MLFRSFSLIPFLWRGQPNIKMSGTCFPLYGPATSLVTKSSTPKPYSFSTSTSKKLPIYHHSLTCKASASPSSSISDFDLYDLLGIDNSSNKSQIKTAYRAFHPDIAGPAGHDMAIILNETYSVLSDAGSRLAYDKVSYFFFTFFQS